MTFKLYVEGGGEGPQLDTRFREAWQRFFRRAGLAGRMPKVVRGGGRSQTFEMYRTALANPRRGEKPLLLLDSEGPVAPGSSVWAHLKSHLLGHGCVRIPPSGLDRERAIFAHVVPRNRSRLRGTGKCNTVCMRRPLGRPVQGVSGRDWRHAP